MAVDMSSYEATGSLPPLGYPYSMAELEATRPRSLSHASSAYELSRSSRLGQFFDLQWRSVASKIDFPEMEAAVRELTGKYEIFCERQPRMSFVESPVGKLHILDFVGMLMFMYPARDLIYESGKNIFTVFTHNLASFYVDEGLASEVLRNVISLTSIEEVWKSVYVLVGSGNSDNSPALSHTDDAERSPASVVKSNSHTPCSSQETIPPPFPEKAESARGEYTILELIGQQPGICSRGETLWRIVSPNGEKFIMRDVWQDEEDASRELELYRKAREFGASHVARIFHHEIVKDSWGRPDSTWYSIRSDLDISLSRRKLQSYFSDDGSIVYETRKMPPSLKDRVETYQPRNPVHNRQIFESGKPWTSCRTLSGIFRGLRDAMKGHRSLGEKASILHRNMTPASIMVTDDESRGFIFGMYGGLEFHPYMMPGSWPWGFTFDKVFVAIELLHTKQYVEHNFYHDLESIFWSLVWESAHYDGPGCPRKDCEQLDSWRSLSYRNLRRAKMALATNDELFDEFMELVVTDFFRPAIEWIRKLRRAVFVFSPSFYDPQLYQWMIEIVESALEHFAGNP